MAEKLKDSEGRRIKYFHDKEQDSASNDDEIIKLEERRTKKKRKLRVLESDEEDEEIRENGNDDEEDSCSQTYSSWVQCDNVNCQKWRKIDYMDDAKEIDEGRWICTMNKDEAKSNCEASQETIPSENEGCCYTTHKPGNIFWGKINGYPWWPCIVENDPDYETFYWNYPMKSPGEIKTSIHVTFFGDDVSRAWIFTYSLQPFTGDEKIKDMGTMIFRKTNYRNAVIKAFDDAKKCLSLTIKERLLEYGFRARYNNNNTQNNQEDISDGNVSVKISKSKRKKQKSDELDHKQKEKKLRKKTEKERKERQKAIHKVEESNKDAEQNECKDLFLCQDEIRKALSCIDYDAKPEDIEIDDNSHVDTTTAEKDISEERVDREDLPDLIKPYIVPFDYDKLAEATEMMFNEEREKDCGINQDDDSELNKFSKHNKETDGGSGKVHSNMDKRDKKDSSLCYGLDCVETDEKSDVEGCKSDINHEPTLSNENTKSTVRENIESVRSFETKEVNSKKNITGLKKSKNINAPKRKKSNETKGEKKLPSSKEKDSKEKNGKRTSSQIEKIKNNDEAKINAGEVLLPKIVDGKEDSARIQVPDGKVDIEFKKTCEDSGNGGGNVESLKGKKINKSNKQKGSHDKEEKHKAKKEKDDKNCYNSEGQKMKKLPVSKIKAIKPCRKDHHKSIDGTNSQTVESNTDGSNKEEVMTKKTSEQIANVEKVQAKITSKSSTTMPMKSKKNTFSVPVKKINDPSNKVQDTKCEDDGKHENLEEAEDHQLIKMAGEIATQNKNPLVTASANARILDTCKTIELKDKSKTCAKKSEKLPKKPKSDNKRKSKLKDEDISDDDAYYKVEKCIIKPKQTKQSRLSKIAKQYELNKVTSSVNTSPKPLKSKESSMFMLALESQLNQSPNKKKVSISKEPKYKQTIEPSMTLHSTTITTNSATNEESAYGEDKQSQSREEKSFMQLENSPCFKEIEDKLSIPEISSPSIDSYMGNQEVPQYENTDPLMPIIKEINPLIDDSPEF